MAKWTGEAGYESWVEEVKDRTAALEATPLPSPKWVEKVRAWQKKESAELLAQHRETTAAMKALAMESQMRHKEHIYKMERYWREHGVGPQSTYSSAGSMANKTR